MKAAVSEPDVPPFAVGNSEMAKRVRAFDWTATPLGHPSKWHAEVKSAVALMLESRFPTAMLWGPDLITTYNDAFRPILGGKPEALGRPFSEVWSEVWMDIEPLAKRAMAGEAVFIENYPLVTNRSGHEEKVYFTFCYSPVRLADGSVAGIMDTVVETTGMVRAYEERELINQELGHRLKNTMAMVQAMAALTLKEVEDQHSVRMFQQRIVALGHAHDVLLQQQWSGASLRDVIHATLDQLAGHERISVDGCDVELSPKAVLGVSLLLHELVTNATKHGALKNQEGRVRLTCGTHDEMFHLHWKELGGPAVLQPERTGFGSRLMQMGFGIGAIAERHFRPEGFEAVFSAPLKNLSDG